MKNSVVEYLHSTKKLMQWVQKRKHSKTTRILATRSIKTKFQRGHRDLRCMYLMSDNQWVSELVAMIYVQCWDCENLQTYHGIQTAMFHFQASLVHLATMTLFVQWDVTDTLKSNWIPQYPTVKEMWATMFSQVLSETPIMLRNLVKVVMVTLDMKNLIEVRSMHCICQQEYHWRNEASDLWWNQNMAGGGPRAHFKNKIQAQIFCWIYSYCLSHEILDWGKKGKKPWIGGALFGKNLSDSRKDILLRAFQR